MGEGANRCRVRDCLSKIVGWGTLLQSPLLLLLRLYWGYQFFQAGKGKFGNLGQVGEFFGSLGIPFPGFNAILVATVETVGGLLLMLGLFSRVAAIPLLITMVVAYLTAHRDAVVTIFSDPSKFTSEAPFLFAVACLLVLAFGPGRIALDPLIGRKTGFKV